MKHSLFRPGSSHGQFLFILVLVLSWAPHVNAQFAHSIGGASFDRGIEVGMDGFGNSYFIGEFQDTLDFDFGPGEFLLKNNNDDVFVASYNSTGDLRFAFEISGHLASKEQAGDIAVAEDGSFVITGSQPFGFIDFDPDPIEEAVRTGELFIAGYSSEGSVRFAVSPPGGENTSSGKGNGVTLDEEGNVYVTGTFVTSLDFNPADTTGILPNAGSNDVFVASYDKDGKYRYAYSFGGSTFDIGSDIVVDSEGNVYVSGIFGGEAFFDPNDSDNNGDTESRIAQSSSDMFFASYDASGSFRFVYTYKGTSSIRLDKKIALSIDGYDNIYMSGESFGTVDFDPEDSNNDGNLVSRTAEPLGSAFITSYSAAGIIRFATVLKGGTSLSQDVYAGDNGIHYITGSFTGDVDFDPNIDDAVLSSDRGADVFVASYDSTGAYRLAFHLPSSGLSSGEAIAVDSLNNIVLTGGFTNELDIQVDAGEDLRTSAGQDDIFMAWFTAREGVSVAIDQPETPSASFDVSLPYPNPFASQTSFDMENVALQQVTIQVFDAQGRQVAQLHNGIMAPGNHKFDWNGNALPNGLYFIRIMQGNHARVLRAMRIR